MAPPVKRKPTLPLTDDQKFEREMQNAVLAVAADSEVKGLPSRAEIGKMAHAVTVKILMRVLADEWEISNAEQAMKVGKFAFDIGRTADGLPTSYSGNTSKDDVKKMIAEARAAQARAEEDRTG